MNFGKNAGDLECVVAVGGNSSRPLKELAKVRFIYVCIYVLKSIYTWKRMT